jgi:putative glutamine amidotransferase
MPIRIGLSASMFPPDPTRPVFNGRALLFVERSMSEWLRDPGVVVYVPCEAAAYDEVADDLDGLVLTGGVDVSPRLYGEEPRRPEWAGDPRRDTYELGLLRAMLERDKPIFGICRGHQLLNVALGGSLHQDLLDDGATRRVHRDASLYDTNSHAIAIEPGSSLAALYPGVPRAEVNTVHHQAIRRLGDGLVVDARSEDDGIIEAVTSSRHRFVRGIQWHPEFRDPAGALALDNGPLRAAFLAACALSRPRA